METSKAHKRRLKQGFFDLYCQGKGIDIGCNNDPIVPGIDEWEIANGDATYMHGVAPGTYDFVYTSHLLEHLNDPVTAIRNWWAILKEGGYLILFVPHRELYDRKDYLDDRAPTDIWAHKMFFLPDRSELPATQGLLELVNRALGSERREFCYMAMCDEGWTPSFKDGGPSGEYSIELVIKKGQRPRFRD